MPEKKTDESELLIPNAPDFTLVHITDLHMCDFDHRDSDRLEFTKKRSKTFGSPNATAKKLIEQVNAEKPDLVAITGDLLDELTAASLDRAEELLQSLEADFIFSRGNHDWVREDTSNKHAAYNARLEAIVKHPLDWHCTQLNGINFVSMDDSDYDFTADQLEKTRRVLESGKPCLFFFHIPLETPTLRAPAEERWGTPILADAEGIALTSRERWGMPSDEVTETTKQFSQLLKSHPQAYGIFCGHIHFNYAEPFPGGPWQYVTNGAFDAGAYRVIKIKGG